MHITGRGRYARETYPQSRASAVHENIRLYGGDAAVGAGTYAATRAESGFTPFTQVDITQDSAIAVPPDAYAISRFSAQRNLFGAGGPVVGDNPITYELLQSVDEGATWTPPGGGPAASVSFAVTAEGTSAVAVAQTVPANALITVRATYPTNYNRAGIDERIYFVIEATSVAA